MEYFFNTIIVRNTQLIKIIIKIKENLIQLLKELVKNKIIHNRLEIVLKSGKKKLPEADRLRLSEDSKSKILTHDEKDALAYFSGKGFYKSYQNLNTPPNLFDTRETFLDKMQNSEMRNNFLKAYKRTIESNNL